MAATDNSEPREDTIIQLAKKKVLWVVGILPLVGLALLVVEVLDLGARLHTVSKEVRSLQMYVRVDSARVAQLRKIEHIVLTYNQELRPETRARIAREVYAMSQKYPVLGVDLICATITHESAFSWDPNVRSRAGALGLMQIMPATGEYLAKVAGVEWTTAEEVLLDPVLNIRLGSRYLSILVETYDVDGGLAAYNGGSYRAALWLRSGRQEGILWRETQNYVPAVLELYERFQNIGLPAMRDEIVD